jgi:hypothetical protein
MAIRAWRFKCPGYWTAREGDCNIDTPGGGGNLHLKNLCIFTKNSGVELSLTPPHPLLWQT